MKVLFDTDVLLDVLLDREPFSGPAAKLLATVERGEVRGYLSPTTITTVFYLARKAIGARRARGQIRDLLSILEVASVGRSVIEEATSSQIPDFEDAVVAYAAAEVSAEYVATRNRKDFKRSPVPPKTPEEILVVLEMLREG